MVVEATLPAGETSVDYLTTISDVDHGPLCCSSTQLGPKMHIVEYCFRPEDFSRVVLFVISGWQESEWSHCVCPRRSRQDGKLKSTCTPTEERRLLSTSSRSTISTPSDFDSSRLENLYLAGSASPYNSVKPVSNNRRFYDNYPKPQNLR